MRRYCPNTRKQDNCPCGGHPSWGTPMRQERLFLAVATLDALGGIDWDARTYRCPVQDVVFPFSHPFEVDRPAGKGTCYTLGTMVLASKDGNQRRNVQGAESAEWTAEYIDAVRFAAEGIARPTGAEARRVWEMFHAEDAPAPVRHAERPFWRK